MMGYQLTRFLVGESIVHHSVMEFQEREVHLRDNYVLIIAGIANECNPQLLGIS
ncbi:hypothetical protein D3C86_2110450 [compost metagenome]